MFINYSFFLLITYEAYRVTNVQISAAILLGVVCSGLNLWRLYRSHHYTVTQPSGIVTVSELEASKVVRRSSTIRSTKKNKSSGAFDNANWVYGDENNADLQESEDISFPSVADEMKLAPEANIMRYATIRRAASILPRIPDNFSAMRTHNQVRSSSFRRDLAPRPVATVQRSKTIHEVASPTESCRNGFAQRFQSSREPYTSDLNFIHNGFDRLEVHDPSNSYRESMPEKLKEEVLQTTDEEKEEIRSEPEERQPLPIAKQAHSSNRIILRVESFRAQPTFPVRVVERFPSAVGDPVAVHKARPVRNINRISSSTQTDLSVLRGDPSAFQRSKVVKRLIVPEPNHPAPALLHYNPPTINTMQVSPGYSVGSSSGYSSPRSTGSKSPTPEPHMYRNVLEGSNVTVIQIDPNPAEDLHRGLSCILDADSIPERRYGTVNRQKFRVKIQPKHGSSNIGRSVSFQNHHLPPTGKKSSAVLTNNWIYSSMASDHIRPPIIPIPRPVLRHNSGRYTSSSTSTTLPRRAPQQRPAPKVHEKADHNSTPNTEPSASAYMAMSEIHHKLEQIHASNELAHSRVSSAPVHGLYPLEPFGDSGYQEEEEEGQEWFSPRRIIPPPGITADPTLGLNSKNSYYSSADKVDQADAKDAKDQTEEIIDPDLTLAYLNQLEDLARHWKRQLMYKVNAFHYLS